MMGHWKTLLTVISFTRHYQMSLQRVNIYPVLINPLSTPSSPPWPPMKADKEVEVLTSVKISSDLVVHQCLCAPALSLSFSLSLIHTFAKSWSLISLPFGTPPSSPNSPLKAKTATTTKKKKKWCKRGGMSVAELDAEWWQWASAEWTHQNKNLLVVAWKRLQWLLNWFHCQTVQPCNRGVFTAVLRRQQLNETRINMGNFLVM